MGASPAKAYSVSSGLGVTMSTEDILDGNIVVRVALRLVRPAAFIELIFIQQMRGGS